MKEEEILNIIETYKLTQRLSNTLRRGWLLWQLDEERIQSIAEHVFGTCMLAITIQATSPTPIDINKVITMLMLHETEEIIIGDLTPYDDRSHKTEDGKRAVLEIFNDYPNSENFLNFIQEFEDDLTPEAKFAHQCDKLEANLFAYINNDKFKLDKVSDKVYNHPQIQEWRKQGHSSVAEWFIVSDMDIYDKDFSDIAQYLLKDTKNKPK